MLSYYDVLHKVGVIKDCKVTDFRGDETALCYVLARGYVNCANGRLRLTASGAREYLALREARHGG